MDNFELALGLLILFVNSPIISGNFRVRVNTAVVWRWPYNPDLFQFNEQQLVLPFKEVIAVISRNSKNSC